MFTVYHCSQAVWRWKANWKGTHSTQHADSCCACQHPASSLWVVCVTFFFQCIQNTACSNLSTTVLWRTKMENLNHPSCRRSDELWHFWKETNMLWKQRQTDTLTTLGARIMARLQAFSSVSRFSTWVCITICINHLTLVEKLKRNTVMCK